MKYQFEFSSYQRQFRQPLHTNHGIWQIREGIIICLTDSQGKRGWGEIAPIPWFGSETMEQALQFCHGLGDTLTLIDIKSIPDNLPACQFAFESAFVELSLPDNPENPDTEQMEYSYLLPPGEAALHQWEDVWASTDFAPDITFKWKIGVYPLDVEMEILTKLTQMLPPQGQLRLDANGGLTFTLAQQLLSLTDSMAHIEFIEQPLPPQQFDLMLDLTTNYQTPLALDESVATFNQLQQCYDKGWNGIFVLKAGITGYPSRLRQFIDKHPIDVVFSSVFETKIGRRAVLRLARELTSGERAVGFGVNSWFDEEVF